MSNPRLIQCPCGELIPAPSYSVRLNCYVTSRHYVTKTEWAPVKSKRGVVYYKPVLLKQICTAFDEQPTEPTPAGSDQPHEPPSELRSSAPTVDHTPVAL